MNLEQFLTDLKTFITEHPYTKAENADVNINEYPDGDVQITLHTVDGDYERIEIQVLLIP